MERFTASLHHINIDLLLTVYFWLQRSSAWGAGGVTRADQELALEVNLTDLHKRIHGNAYPANSKRMNAFRHHAGLVASYTSVA
ncbi:MAG: hypothetical protein HKN43_10195 [Rhodothermales bacterium]|nr:hypothetical protein [Rhodothermales bacterium]